jgi:hypothetical protein
MKRKKIVRIAQVTFAAAVALTLAGLAEAGSNRSDKIILVRPTELPELARVPGQAMLLRETGDGKTLLYIEQDHGARLAIFDVSDPAKIKAETAVRLDAPGSFDFVSSLGDNVELIRFRHGQGDALLDLRKAKAPSIDTVEGLTFQGPIDRLGDDGIEIANEASVQSATNAVDYQVVETPARHEPIRVYDVKQVREEITNDETGETFLLTADGLYVIRRPAVEEEYDTHQWQMSHPG